MRKRCLLFVLCLMITGVCFASIRNANVQAKLITIVKAVKSQSVNTAIYLGNLKSEVQSIIANWQGEISPADKTNLQNLNGLVLTAKDALDDVNDYIVLTWGSIE